MRAIHIVMPMACAAVLAAASVAAAPVQVYGESFIRNSGLNSSANGGFNFYNGYGSYSNPADNGSAVAVTIGPASGGFVEVSGNGNTESDAYGVISYDLRLNGNGPVDANGMVKMLLTTKGVASTTGFYEASAGIGMSLIPLHSFDFFLPIPFQFFHKSCSGSSYNCPGGLAGDGGWDVTNFEFFMFPNRDYTLTMNASVRQRQPDYNSISVGGAGTLKSGSGHAYVDPVITIAPGVTGFTLFSSGPPMGAGAVPEPASWALMLAGFGAVGGLARRRRAIPRVAG